VQVAGRVSPSRCSPLIQSILDTLDDSVGSVEQAVGLPPECYTDPAFFEFEKDAIFYKEWLCVGRVEQVQKPGDYFSLTIVDEPIVVVRSGEHEIRVMSAVCRHRGMVITSPGQVTDLEDCKALPETAGNRQVFVCPYHGWTYDLEGRLKQAPEMDRTIGFDKDAVCLPNFRTEVWNGFIFVNFDQGAAPLAPRLARLEEYVKNWHLDTMVDVDPQYVSGMPWNWKVMHENSMEAYHVDRLHAGLHAVLPSSGVLPTVYEEGDAALILLMTATQKDYALNPTFKPLLPLLDTLSDEDRLVGRFALIPPTLLVAFNTDSAYYRIVLPIEVGKIDIRFGDLVPRQHLRARRHREVRKMITEGVRILGRQDFPTNAAVQKGLRSRFATRTRYSWQEDALPCFNRWLVARYRAAARTPVAAP
jgi:phenylpropionate dioxygenase-like ring-hydroxylating dioxygenase large terminal subunit